MKDLFVGSEPAFPLVNDSPNDQRNFVEYGMSKRFYAACAAMQGLCVNKVTSEIKKGECVDIAEMAYLIADELLKQENETNN